MVDFNCDNCGEDGGDKMYEGWFYTRHKLNPFVTNPLIQLKVVCERCLRLLSNLGLSKAKTEDINKIIKEG